MYWIFRTALKLALACLVVAGLVALALHQATRHVPEFYQQALRPPSVESGTAGAALEQAVLQLRNDIHELDQWQAVITADEINHWLAVDLQDKFPRALPPQIQEPRIAVQNGQLIVACRMQNYRTTSVLSLRVEPFLTADVDQIAIRICSARAGWLPVPLGKVLEQCDQAARDKNVRLSWAQRDGAPVAIVSLPPADTGDFPRVQLKSIQLRDGAIHLTGTTRRPPAVDSATTEPHDVPIDQSGANEKVQIPLPSS